MFKKGETDTVTRMNRLQYKVFSSSGMSCPVVRLKSANFSEEHAAYIFKVFNLQRTTRRYIPENRIRHNYRHDSPRFYSLEHIFLYTLIHLRHLKKRGVYGTSKLSYSYLIRDLRPKRMYFKWTFLLRIQAK